MINKELAKKLRETWPIIKAGPITTAQRALIHKAADALEGVRE
jgi:hypothetical protein